MPELLRRIPEQYPAIRFPEVLHNEILDADSRGIKAAADKLDSMLCSTLLYRHAIYRGQTTQMIGDEENGFILLCR
jgi:predicted RNase H-like nuclease